MRHRYFSAAVFTLCALLLLSTRLEAATVTLAWDPSPDPVNGYIVRYGTSSRTYTVEIDVGRTTQSVVTINTPGTTTYYFAVVAYNSVGRSADSAEVSTAISNSLATMFIDRPAAGQVTSSDLLLSGWAIDRGAVTTTGVDAIHIYAYPNPGSGAAPIFLGVASMGGARGDVGAAFGSQYSNSGFTLPITGLAPGTYDLAFFAHSTVANAFSPARTVRITVSTSPPATGALLAVDTPTQNATIAGMLSVGGWSIDRRSTTGTGIDRVELWAYPSPGSGAAPLFLGNAPYGARRNDVGSLFGTRYALSAYNITVAAMGEGVYNLVALGHSTVTGGMDVARVVRVTIQPAVLVAVDRPSVGSTVTGPFWLSGWAIDRRATANPGIDALHIWAYPNPGSGAAAIFVGVANVGVARPDVGGIFGSQFNTSGYDFLVTTLAPGVYDVVVFGHSAISGAFENARVVRVTVQ